MSYLGSLNGTGRIVLDGADIGEAQYEISVYQPKFLKEANGTISADMGVISAIFAGKGAILILKDGSSISIFCTRTYLSEGRADIAISGPIPGF